MSTNLEKLTKNGRIISHFQSPDASSSSFAIKSKTKNPVSFQAELLFSWQHCCKRRHRDQSLCLACVNQKATHSKYRTLGTAPMRMQKFYKCPAQHVPNITAWATTIKAHLRDSNVSVSRILYYRKGCGDVMSSELRCNATQLLVKHPALYTKSVLGARLSSVLL